MDDGTKIDPGARIDPEGHDVYAGIITFCSYFRNEVSAIHNEVQKGMKILKRNESFYFMYNTVRMQTIMVTW